MSPKGTKGVRNRTSSYAKLGTIQILFSENNLTTPVLAAKDYLLILNW